MKVGEKNVTLIGPGMRSNTTHITNFNVGLFDSLPFFSAKVVDLFDNKIDIDKFYRDYRLIYNW